MSSVSVQRVQIDIEKCRNKTGITCKSDEDIDLYFAKRNFYILHNEVRFDYQKYGAESIIKQSKIRMESLGDWQTRTVYKVVQTELALQDLAFNLDEITELQDSSVFTLQRGQTVTKPHANKPFIAGL